jgi:tetratricopeptide (TPR) repeat protein
MATKEFIPHILMILSAAGVIFIIARRVPESIGDIKKENDELKKTTKKEKNKVDIKEKFIHSLEKFLRKVKVFILRGDTKIMEVIKKLRKERTKEEKQVFQEKKEEKKKTEKKESTIKKKISRIRKKVMTQKEKAILKINDLRKQSKKPEITTPPLKSIDIQEARKVMLERQEQVLIKKIARNPRDDSAYVELGKLYMNVGNIVDAKASLNQALKINQGNIKAKKVLTEIERQR